MIASLRPLGLALGLSVLAQSCADLPAIPAGTCGNGVVDPGEDCDTFAPNGLRCRAAGAASACRFDCARDATTKARAACPTGWGCGTDTICRNPSGRFSATGEIVASGSEKLRTADVDGDGLLDLVGTSPGDLIGRSSVRVHFFDRGARLAKTSTIPALLSGSSVGDVTGDGVADVVGVAGYLEGIATFAGQSDRTPAPNAYPALTVPQGSTIRALALDVLNDPMHRGDETLIFSTLFDAKSGMTFHELAVTTEVAHPLLLLDHTPDELAGKVPIGSFVESGPCAQIVIAYTGAPSLAVFSPCRPDGAGGVVYNFVKPNGQPEVPPIVVSLPSGDTIGARVLDVDVDVDGHLDLVIDAGGHTLVAYGDGKGGFFPKPGASGAPLTAGPLPLPAGVDSVVAFGRASGGSARYLVTPHVVYLTPSAKSPICPGVPADTAASCEVAANLGAPWTEAIVADLNRDLSTDVLASSAESNDLDYYAGSPLGLLNVSTISTLGAVSHLTLGDFDGDLVADVAFVQAGSHGAAQTVGDGLHVLFGRAFARPEAPVFVGRFDRIEDVISASLAPPMAKTSNDLGVTSRSEDGTEQNVAILYGNADRVLLAPFGLQQVAPPDVLTGRAIATTLGQVAGESRLDAIAIAIDEPDASKSPPKFRLWITESQKHGRFATPIVSEPAPKSVHPLASVGRQVVFLTAGDLDGDGFDEIVYVGLDAAVANASMMLIASTGGTGTITLRDPIALPRYAPPSGHVALADVDGDGHLDLVMLTRTVSAPSELSLDATEVSIYWGVAGGFDSTAPGSIVAPDGAPLLDLAFVTRGAGRDVAFASETATWLAVRDGRTFTVTDPVVTGGSGLATGDLDGDGVEDLAVASDGSIRVFRGEAVKP